MNGQIQYGPAHELTSEATRSADSELAEIRAAQETAELADRISRDGLPIVESLHHLQPQERCHFVTPVRFGRRRSDQYGHLELTSNRVRFHGALDVSVVWSEVATVDRAGREIVISLVNSRRVFRFSCHAMGEAAHGALLAHRLAGGATPATTRAVARSARRQSSRTRRRPAEPA